MSKITIYVIVVTQSLSLALANMSHAQRSYLKDISIEISNAQESRSLVDLINEIESAGDFKFAYSKSEIRRKEVKIAGGKWDMGNLLKEISTQARLSVKRVNESIALTVAVKSQELPDVLENITIQEKITGKINGEDGSGLPGATVLEKGTGNGTVTDINGNYSISVDDGAILVISFVGYLSQEVTVQGRSIINVSLEEDLESLEEVIVIGYGSIRKSDLTGAVTSVASEELQRSASANLDQKLQGLAAGVFVNTSSNQPGGAVSIRIRGISSINAGTEPLYVIDGTAITTEGTGTGLSGNVGPTISPLSSINPDDIESIEVLKDASSTAIYGARGSNGVILITTKKGKSGKGIVNFNTSWRSSSITKKLNVLNGDDFSAGYHNALRNSMGYTFHETLSTEAGELTNVFTWNGDDATYDAQLASYYEGQDFLEGEHFNTDWQDQIFVNGSSQNTSLSVSGGTGKNSHYFSLGRNDINGIIKNSDFARTSLRINTSSNVGKLTIGENLSVTDVKANYIRTEGDRQNEGVSSVIAAALRYKPTSDLTESDENGQQVATQDAGVTNPAEMTTNITNETNNLRIYGNVFGQYQFTPNLFFKSIFGVDYETTRDQFYAPQEGSFLGSLSGGYARVGSSQSREFTSTNMLNFSKDFGVHSINATAVNEVIWSRSDRMLNVVAGFPNDLLREYDLSSGASVSPPQSYTQDYSLASVLGRVNYSYDNRFLATVSARHDGSSRFGKEDKWAFFPSGSVAWRISEENFMDNMSVVDDLKLRVSYGIVGNQNIALYSSTAPLASSSYILNDQVVTGYYPVGVANPFLRWERKKQMNIGVDFGLLENRISGSIEYYQDRTDDLLINKPIPSASGYPQIVANLGEIENTGLEFSVSAIIVNKAKFSWKANANVAFPRNKVLNLGGLENFPAGTSGGGLTQTQRLIVGEATGQFYGLKKTGIAKTPEDLPYTLTGNYGSKMYADISGANDSIDGGVDINYDRVVIGDANPDFFGGITNTITYGDWGLSIFFQGSFGNDIMNITRAVLNSGTMDYNALDDVDDNAWQPEVVDATTGAVVHQGNPGGETVMLNLITNADETSDDYIEDGSYLRLKNISLSYTLPASVCKKINVSSLQLTLSGTNLLTFTNYSGYDPEVDSQRNGSLGYGHDFFGYPQSKSYAVGLNVTF